MLIRFTFALRVGLDVPIHFRPPSPSPDRHPPTHLTFDLTNVLGHDNVAKCAYKNSRKFSRTHSEAQSLSVANSARAREALVTRYAASKETCQDAPRHGEVSEVCRGVRRGVSSHLLPASRSLVQAVHRAQLLLGGSRLRFVVRDQEVAVRPEVRVRRDAGGQRGGAR